MKMFDVKRDKIIVKKGSTVVKEIITIGNLYNEDDENLKLTLDIASHNADPVSVRNPIPGVIGRLPNLNENSAYGQQQQQRGGAGSMGTSGLIDIPNAGDVHTEFRPPSNINIPVPINIFDRSNEYGSPPQPQYPPFKK